MRKRYIAQIPRFTMTDNPFAVLTAVVAPAILTNASSVLCLGTSNRIARVVDRTRVVAAEIGSFEAGSSEYLVRVNQLERLQTRAQLLFRALRITYASLGAFAAAALISVIGSAMAYYDLKLVFQAAAVAGLVIGAFGVTGLVSGCVLMVQETQLALQNISEEAELARIRLKHFAETSSTPGAHSGSVDRQTPLEEP
jgi:Protein of unknown function (DUF2721)